MHLIQKGDSNSKHFSFFVFYFNVSDKISSTAPGLINFSKIFQTPLFTPIFPFILSFEELPPVYSNLPPVTPAIKRSRVGWQNQS